MCEVERIKLDIESKNKWLEERQTLLNAIKTAEDCNFYLGYWRDSGSFGSADYQYKTYIPENITLKIVELLKQELSNFDFKGYDMWLENYGK